MLLCRFAARFDCGIHYELTVQLLGDVRPGAGEERGPDYSRPLDEFQVQLDKEAGRVWYPVSILFIWAPDKEHIFMPPNKIWGIIKKVRPFVRLPVCSNLDCSIFPT